MSTNPWDDPDFATASGEFVKFDNIGDGVSGVVTSIGKKVWDDGSISPQLGIDSDDGEARTLTAGQVRLKAALAVQRPGVGDHLSAFLEEIIKRPGGKTLKHFRVEVKRGGKKATASKAAPVDTDEPPF